MDTVKATENVQRAQTAVAERHSGCLYAYGYGFAGAHQGEAGAEGEMKAAGELAEETSDVSSTVEEAGITPDSDEFLSV